MPRLLPATLAFAVLLPALASPGPGAPLAGLAPPDLCLLDTGVDPAHDDLDDGQVVAWRDLLGGKGEAFDDHGHGTHLAGVAVGSGHADASRPGAWPGAALAVGRVLDGHNRGTARAAAEGLAWCLALGARVVALALEEDACRATPDLAGAVARALAADVLVVASAGNRGAAPGEACAIRPPGSLAGAFTVGALDGPGADAAEVAAFSGRGAPGSAKPDAVAPGAGVLGARAGTRDALHPMDGASVAVPWVAAHAARLRAAHPDASAELVAQALQATARDGGPPGHDPAWGWGAIAPDAAAAWLAGRLGGPAAAPLPAPMPSG